MQVSKAIVQRIISSREDVTAAVFTTKIAAFAFSSSQIAVSGLLCKERGKDFLRHGLKKFFVMEERRRKQQSIAISLGFVPF